MKTIHLKIHIEDTHDRRQTVVVELIKPMDDKVTEDQVARFILMEASERISNAKRSHS